MKNAQFFTDSGGLVGGLSMKFQRAQMMQSVRAALTMDTFQRLSL